MNILIIEPDMSQMTILVEFLGTQGRYNVEVARNAMEAMQVVNKENFSLVISNFFLPDSSAITLFKEIRMAVPKPPVFAVMVVNGQMSDEENMDLLRLGCSMFLDVPLNLNQIRDSLATSLGQRHSEQNAPFFGSSNLNNEHVEQTPLGDSNNNSFVGDNSIDAYKRKSTEVLGNYTRRPSEGTGRIRRSVTASISKKSSNLSDSENLYRQPPVTSITRRSVLKPTVSGEVRQVRCAICSKVFSVPSKDVAFNIACLHCGKLNKILPK